MSAGAPFLAVLLACVVRRSPSSWQRARPGTGAPHWGASVPVSRPSPFIVAVLGPAVTAIPLHWLRPHVGGLLLVFGLQWSRKAILRASGHKALHDEQGFFREQVVRAQTARPVRRG